MALSTCVAVTETHIDSFLISSLKLSPSCTSGSPWKANRWAVGDGDRGGSLAPGCGFDLTRTGMSWTLPWALLCSALHVVSILGLVMSREAKETMAKSSCPRGNYGRISILFTDLELALKLIHAQATPQSQVHTHSDTMQRNASGATWGHHHHTVVGTGPRGMPQSLNAIGPIPDLLS